MILNLIHSYERLPSPLFQAVDRMCCVLEGGASQGRTHLRKGLEECRKLGL